MSNDGDCRVVSLLAMTDRLVVLIQGVRVLGWGPCNFAISKVEAGVGGNFAGGEIGGAEFRTGVRVLNWGAVPTPLFIGPPLFNPSSHAPICGSMWFNIEQSSAVPKSFL